jgi:membrane protein involved in colicin uptake
VGCDLNIRYSIVGLFLALSVTSVSAAPQNAAHPASRGPAPGAHSGNNAAVQAATNAYLGRLRSKLQNNWYLADGSNSVQLSVTLSADGNFVDEVHMESTPKNAPAEQAASDAFAKVQPLEPLPSGLSQAKLELTFISNADPHGDTSSHIVSKMVPIGQPKSEKEPEKQNPASK